jgi:hypothetical protein
MRAQTLTLDRANKQTIPYNYKPNSIELKYKWNPSYPHYCINNPRCFPETMSEPSNYEYLSIPTADVDSPRPNTISASGPPAFPEWI